MQPLGTTPLISLAVLVLDCEATALDARKAHLIQIGWVKAAGGSIEEVSSGALLVRPPAGIPAASSKVHGLTDRDVADAPPFRAVAEEIGRLLGERVVVGHNIGYDIALIGREMALAGVPFQAPRSLDIRLLARVALPTLASYTLDALCGHLGIVNAKRHDALGDARATAEVYLKLLPPLRQRGIRTLAEAETACRGLGEEHVPGWAQPSQAGNTQALQRIDSYPYRHRVRDVMSAPALVLAGSATAAEALDALIGGRVSSVLVRAETGEHGIVTERDLLRLVQSGRGLAMPLVSVMQGPLQTVAADDFVYRAIGRMDRLGIRHLAVTEADGSIAGMVTPRNLLRQRASAAIALGDEIDRAGDVASVAGARAKLPAVARSLIAEEVDPRRIAEVVSSEIASITAWAAREAEARLGPAPAAYAVLVLGSVGRGESLLAADQDNAIVFEHGEPGGEADRYFAELGGAVADSLDAAGIPYCKGGVMARTPEWRLDVAGWRARIEGWMRRSRPQDLLNVDIFFDAVPVHGERRLAESIADHAFAAAQASKPFLKLLAELARETPSPFGILGGLSTDGKGRLDLKKHGLMPIFTGARVLAIRHGVRARSTPERLRAVAGFGAGAPEEIEAVIEAHRVLLGLVLEQQLADGEAGVPLSSQVEIGRLPRARKAELKAALGRVQTLAAIVGEGRL